MKVLITGGFGYLGGRLAQFLSLLPDYKVVLGSRKNNGTPDWLLNAKVVQTEWHSIQQLEKICKGIDVIVHMAGMNAQDCANDPAAAVEFNAVATARLVQAAIKTKVKRFVYLSTAHIYDSPLTGDITEETCPVSLHPYATSHKAAEDVVRAAFNCNQIEGVIIRLSNAFGAPVTKDVNCWMLLVNDLCLQAALNGRMVLKSSGLQRRDFIAITDFCNAVRHLLELPADKLDNGVFNIGGGRSSTIKEMAQIVAERFNVLTGDKPDIEYLTNPNSETSDKLNYKINKLIDTDFKISQKNNFEQETDKLIWFCINN